MEVLALVLGCVLIWVGAFGAGRVEEAAGVRVPRADRKTRWRAFVLGTALVLLVLGNKDSTRRAVRTTIDSLSRPQPADSPAFSLTPDTNPAPRLGAIPAPADTVVAVHADTTPAPATDPAPAFGGFHSRVRVMWTIYGTPYVGEMDLDGTAGSLLVSFDADGGRRQVLQDLRLERRDQGWFYMGSNPRDPASQEPSATYRPDFFHVSFVEGDWKFDQACDASACVGIVVVPAS